MNVCLFVWNLYKSTFLNRFEPNFAHVSPLVWRRSSDMYGPTIFQLSHVFDLFCRERVPIRARKMAAGARVPRYYVIARVGVTSRTWRALCIMHRKRGEVNEMRVCENGNPIRRVRKKIMNCTCNCTAFVQMITYNLSNIRPSSFGTLSRNNTFFRLLNLSCRSCDTFR